MEALNDATLEGVTAQQITDACETMPMMCEKRIVTVRDWAPLMPGKAKNEEADAEWMQKWLENPPETCALVFYMRSDMDGRKKMATLLKKKAVVVDFQLLTDAELTRWCARRLKPLGKRISPAALNTLIAFSAFFTDIGYYFDEQNNFGRGPLGLTPYVVMFFYVLVLFLRSFRVFAMRNSEEALILLFLAITATVGSLLTAMSLEIDVNLAFAAEVALYYLYIYAQSTKRDALTGLFNRQSFYSDLRKHQSSLTGVVSIDMNELKWLNDTQGHEAGDRALKEISAVFLAASTGRDRVYRTGGDEFIMLCRSGSEKEIAALVDRMRSNVQAAGYSCAFGLSAGKQAGEMMQEADARMYADKARLKAEAAASGKALHMRD